MTYYTGTVAPVPETNRQAHVAHVRRAWPILREHGATRLVEAWGEDVPRGRQTDFFRAVDAQQDEAPVFSWIEWPNRATADAAFARMMDDPGLHERMGEIPFDGQRMIWGGFSPLVTAGTDRGAGWFQGFLIPVPEASRQAYADLAREVHETMFAPNGCAGIVEAWGEDVPRGRRTDMHRATAAQQGEAIVISWTAWPDRATCAAAARAMEAAMEGRPVPEMPFDGQRMIFGGFAPLFDSDRA